MRHKVIATLLGERFRLESPPVALAYVMKPPKGVSPWSGPSVPSACTFWRRAEHEVFFATAEQHMNCPIGALTSGFQLTPAADARLALVLEQMTGCHYLKPAEPSSLPGVEKQKTGVLYGPLSAFPIDPDLILIWADARQAMLIEEISGNARWDAQRGINAFGRPTCAALPLALKEGRTVVSFGCAGMRTFTEVDDAKMLAVLPGRNTATLQAAVERAFLANATVQALYDEMKASHPG